MCLFWRPHYSKLRATTNHTNETNNAGDGGDGGVAVEHVKTGSPEVIISTLGASALIYIIYRPRMCFPVAIGFLGDVKNLCLILARAVDEGG